LTGDGLGRGLLVGARDCEELLLDAVVDHADGASGGGGDEGHEAGDSDGGVHFEGGVDVEVKIEEWLDCWLLM